MSSNAILIITIIKKNNNRFKFKKFKIIKFKLKKSIKVKNNYKNHLKFIQKILKHKM